MLARHQDAIAAIATASGRGAVGILRVSGADLAPWVQALMGRALQPRHAHYLPISGADGQAMDHGIALWFPAPHSYTGEDVLELQVHGGPVVLEMILARCFEVAAQQDATATDRAARLSMRLADPGEFTLRAFLKGKMDLAQAEAVSDLIDASTQVAARSATRSLEGVFSRAVDAIHQGLIDLRVLVEATMDFPEEDIDFIEQANVKGRLLGLEDQLSQLIEQTRQGVLLREGMQVVLAGQPNVGKSSLLNALAGSDLAIVTDVPGTTRDRVSTALQIEGVPLHVIDTAGLRDTSDAVERIGIERSWEAIRAAEVVIFLQDLSRVGQSDYEQGNAEILEQLQTHGVQSARILTVYNKSDAATAHGGLMPGIRISAKTGEGLQSLRAALLERAGWHPSAEGNFIARARHVEALASSMDHLRQAQSMVSAGDCPLELCAEELRLAHEGLGSITGAMSADDLLGQIFSRFCIGK